MIAVKQAMIMIHQIAVIYGKFMAIMNDRS